MKNWNRIIEIVIGYFLLAPGIVNVSLFYYYTIIGNIGDGRLTRHSDIWPIVTHFYFILQPPNNLYPILNTGLMAIAGAYLIKSNTKRYGNSNRRD
jgi:hypothetical protein